MGTSTVSGPFRSQNGFQELVNGVWTPVGGGGGGYTFATLYGEYGPNASLDNRYSDSFYTVSGPTAGTVITLPEVPVGGTIAINLDNGASTSVWKIKVPTPAGADFAFIAQNLSVNLSNDFTGLSAPTSSWQVWDEVNDFPSDSVYLYGTIQNMLTLVRAPDMVYPGFGVIVSYYFVTPMVTVGGYDEVNQVAVNFNRFPAQNFTHS
jgi:hypothetical protein